MELRFLAILRRRLLTLPLRRRQRMDPTRSVSAVSDNSSSSTTESPSLKDHHSATSPILLHKGDLALRDPKTPVALSFSGCGFLGVYHIGVASALRTQAPSFLTRVHRYAGTSAGSLVAALLVYCPERLDEACATFYNLADEVNKLKFGALTPGFSIIRRLGELAESMLPEVDGSQAGRIFVSLTTVEGKLNKLASRFESKADLIAHLLASCFIPVYAGINEPPIKIQDKEYVDGGLSDNLPRFKDVRTVTVSPFSGEAEIAPRDVASPLFDWSMTLANQIMKVNLKNVVRGAQALFPPKREVLRSYHDLGYRDAMRFLLDHGLMERPTGTPV